MATDNYGRDLHYLRISITDRCNFQCTYCMPENVTFRSAADLMTDDEILIFTRLFADLGFFKVRLTGGEPTLRKNIVELVRRIAHVPGVQELTMTTNGVLLKDLAQPLAQAGLQRVNISLDSLDPARFCEVTRRGSLEAVWDGIHAAEEAGLTPIKINVVILENIDAREVCRLAGLTLTRDWQVRFIEWMPLGGSDNDLKLPGVTAVHIQNEIEKCLGPLEILNEGKLDGEARLYRLKGGSGDLGFITSVSDPFCDSCSRIRLTADGRMRLCLLHEDEVDLLTPLRSGMDLDTIRSMILEGIRRKPKGHDLALGEIPKNRQMSEIGG